MRTKTIRLALILTLAVCTGPAWADEVVRTIEDSWGTADVAEVYLDFPLGEATIEATQGDRVEVVIELACDDGWGSSGCPDRAERIEMLHDISGDRMELTLDGYSRWRSRGLEVNLRMRVPERLALWVDMGIGELEIEGMRNDVTVDMGIGEASVSMRAEDVGRVALDTGIGETSLRTPDGRTGAAGLFTSEVDWPGASGEARVRVDLGIGEIDVRLR
jgi:hypothetical protein